MQALRACNFRVRSGEKREGIRRSRKWRVDEWGGERIARREIWGGVRRSGKRRVEVRTREKDQTERGRRGIVKTNET